MTEERLTELLRLIMKYGTFKLLNKSDKSNSKEFDFENNIKSMSDRTIDFFRMKENVAILDEKYLIPKEDNVAFTVHHPCLEALEHSHNFIEIIYVFSGQCTQVINDEIINMKKGDLCILSMNAIHKVEPTTEDDIIINLLIRKSFFDSNFIARLSENNILSTFLIEGFYKDETFDKKVLINNTEQSEIRMIIITLLNEYINKFEGYNEVIYGLMIAFFNIIHRENVKTGNKNTLEISKLVDVISYMENNYKDISLNSVAERFHFNPKYLSRIITKATGKSFSEILQGIRVRNAANLLEKN